MTKTQKRITMITKEQAMIENNFTHATLLNKDKTPVRLRRSGKTQTWKTRPNDFKIPVKYGLYESIYITQDNCENFNPAS